MRRLIIILALIAIPLAAIAQQDGGGIDVIDVSGPLDASALEFISSSIDNAADIGQELAVIQVNSEAVLDGPSYDTLAYTLLNPPLPVAMWVGPAPAVASGGVAPLVYSVGQASISPGSEIGQFNPVVLGEDRVEIISPSEPLPAEESGLEQQATIRQYLQALDGRVFETATGDVEVSTIEEYEDGVTVKQVTFRKPGIATRFFRLAVTPEAAFFFLVIGLSIVTFEFYALGPGVAAGVAAISLLLGGWGLINLPTRGWALAVVLAGWVLLTAAYQKGGVFFMTVVGTVLLQVGGMFLVDGSGLIDPRWYLIAPSVLGVLFFFLIAMPTVQRARLSTQTIGRESLVGLEGLATTDFGPEGKVQVNNAAWMASAHREAGIKAGDVIVVSGVDGLYLEVEPLAEGREISEEE